KLLQFAPRGDGDRKLAFRPRGPVREEPLKEPRLRPVVALDVDKLRLNGDAVLGTVFTIIKAHGSPPGKGNYSGSKPSLRNLTTSSWEMVHALWRPWPS